MKFITSSYVILSVFALFSGATGALLSGMWDFSPPDAGIYSYGNYFDGAVFGAIMAAFGLIPYWAFHILTKQTPARWIDIRWKPLRLAWVFIWASFLGFFWSRGLAV